MKTTKEMIDVMQAYLDGEQIEESIDQKVWFTCEPIWNWAKNDYRVKPKTKYVPFETADEFLEVQRKHSRVLFDVKNRIFCNGFVNKDGMFCATYKHSFKICSLKDAFDNYEFYNGTPCGKEIEL